MGVGDYIHSKELGQHRAATQTQRQFLAEQAKVQVPTTTLVAPAPLGLGVLPGGNLPHAPELPGPQQGDMFDTDVEGVDESTVAGTSVPDNDEYRVQPQVPQPPQQPQPPPSQLPVPQRQARRSYQFHHGRRLNWYENLGDKAMKSAGFESEDADDDDDEGSQLTSVAGDDERDEPNDWFYSHKPRIAPDEPLSKRLENFWNASKRASAGKSTTRHPEMTKTPALAPSGSESRKLDQVIPTASGSRKITLPRSMTATPRTRFSPPKPSLLEQLDNSPTRRGDRSQSRPRRESVIDLRRKWNTGDESNLFDDDHHSGGRGDSLDGHSMTAFDITNVVALDEDDTLQDPFLKKSIASPTAVAAGPSSTRKRHLEPDYPPEILYQKSFDDLQAEPFDHAPPRTSTTTATTAKPTPPPPSTPQGLIDTSANPEEKSTNLANLSDADRRTYFSNLSIDEWEACGDHLIEQFGSMLLKMKDLRHARRKTAAVFEAEIKRRNGVVVAQNRELGDKMDVMRSGGSEVLRGRTPR